MKMMGLVLSCSGPLRCIHPEGELKLCKTRFLFCGKGFSSTDHLSLLESLMCLRALLEAC